LWTEDGERWMVATPSTAQQVRGNSRRRGQRFGDAGVEAVPVQPASYDEDAPATRY